MFDKFANKFITNLSIYAFTSLFLGIPIIIYLLLKNYLWIGVVALGVFLFFVAYGSFKDLYEDEDKEHKNELDKITKETGQQVSVADQNFRVAEHKEQMWRQLLKERTSGFPTLFEHIANYEKLIDDDLSGFLRSKAHPAYNASEIVKMEAGRRREAEYIQRKTQMIIEYYENIAPFLLDFKEQEISETEEKLRDYTQEEVEDPVSQYLAKEEYIKLPSVVKNQKALDRFWTRPKSKWLLGRIYERYVGYIYENQGYDVEYTGVVKGYEDLGRDLICSKGSEIIVIQCKNWSQFKTIFEKHIFQFFGTVFQYKDSNPSRNVKAIFYTTTELSDLARRFAKELDIGLMEKFKMARDYPCIKCNISANSVKIYHLPFDQMYDNTKIEPAKGEFYCATVKEAEEKGFRRAWRWRGQQETA